MSTHIRRVIDDVSGSMSVVANVLEVILWPLCRIEEMIIGMSVVVVVVVGPM